MSSELNPLPMHSYLVRVGHNQVTVVCQSAAEAIVRAKCQLRRELPRLWDVISSLSENKFHVERLDR